MQQARLVFSQRKGSEHFNHMVILIEFTIQMIACLGYSSNYSFPA